MMDPNRHKFLENNHKLFDYIVTYDDKLIEMFPEKVIITPYSSTWVWPVLNQSIHLKSKLCSYITSKKQHSSDQQMRIRLLDYFYDNRDINIELYGRGHNPLPENHDGGEYDSKILALQSFAFTLVIENHIQKHYFSEKLMDCILVGTIPIYHGCSGIDKYFNIDGMILFNNEEEMLLEKIFN